MNKAKKLVTISITTIFIATVIISILGWNFATFDSRFSDQKCSRQGKYCVFKDIPTGMMFTKPDQSLEGVHKFQGNLSEYLTLTYPTKNGYPKRQISISGEVIAASKPGSVPTPEDFYIWDLENYICTSTQAKPRIIEYFREFSDSNRRFDYGNGRRAIVCGNIYLIQENQEYESKLYGPYDLSIN